MNFKEGKERYMTKFRGSKGNYNDIIISKNKDNFQNCCGRRAETDSGKRPLAREHTAGKKG